MLTSSYRHQRPDAPESERVLKIKELTQKAAETDGMRSDPRCVL